MQCVCQAASTLLIGLTILLLFGRLKSALSMPIGIVVDYPQDHIHVDTVLNSCPRDPVYRRIADVASSRVMEAGVVLLWHGIWSFMDLFLEDEVIGLWLGFAHILMLYSEISNVYILIR